MSSVPTPQGVGISWECASSSHGGCHTAGCRCMCHYRAGQADSFTKREVVSTPIEKLPTPPNDAPEVVRASTVEGKKCSKCGRMAPNANDKFCRFDGTPLEAPVHCGNCGTKAESGDLHCANCGAPLSQEIQTVPRRPRKRKDNLTS